MISSYGSTEAGYVFMECAAGRLHQVTESCRVDFVPFQNGHGEGRTGKILVTTLGNPWRVLIRFDMGDLARLEDDLCPCGRNDGMTLAAVEGRLVNITMTPDGRAVTQRQVDSAVANVPGVAEYQLVQKDKTLYKLILVKEQGGDNGLMAREATRVLGRLYGPDACIRVSFESAVKPQVPPGKYRLARADFEIDTGPLFVSTR
jgi:phenylacetate-CoA ligase